MRGKQIVLLLVGVLGGICSSFSQTVGSPAGSVGYLNLAVPAGFSLLANPLSAEVNTVGQLLKKAPSGTVVFSMLGAAPASPLPLPDGTETLINNGFLKMIPTTSSFPVKIESVGGAVNITWAGELQSSASLFGPFSSVNEAGPSAVFQTGQSQRFWRAQISTALGSDRFTGNVFDSGSWSNPSQTFVPGIGLLIYTPYPFTNTFSGTIVSGTLTNAVPSGWSLRSCLVPFGNAGITSKMGLVPNHGDHVITLTGGTLNEFVWNKFSGWYPSEPILNAGQAVLIYANKDFDWVTSFVLAP